MSRYQQCDDVIMESKLYTFVHNNKRNPFILFKIKDSSNNQFYKNSDGEIQFPFDVVEYSERIGEMAYGCEVLVDDIFLKANKYIPPTKKTTIVFCDNVKQTSANTEYKHRRGMKFLPKRDLYKYVFSHELRRKTPLFFSMSEETLRPLNLYKRLFDVMEIFEIDRSPKNLEVFGGEVKIISHTSSENIITKYSDKNNSEQDKADNQLDYIEEFNDSGNIKLTQKVDKSLASGFKYKIKRYIK